MTDRDSPVLIGLTGGIASGKSTVAETLRDLGAIIVDADQLSREVVAAGTDGLAEVAAAFGPEVIDEHGEMNRAAVGAVVFADEQRRNELNSIIHPRVRAASQRLVDEAGSDDVVVQDVPLLVESGQAERFDLVLVVHTDEPTRIQRMVELRSMTREDAEARIRAQATDEQRAAVADVVLVNHGTVDDLSQQTRTVWQERIMPLRG